MKTNRLLIGGWALAAIISLSACSTSRQVALKDDMYNNQATRKVNNVYQSPDYYYTGNEEQAQQDNSFYSDEYSDQEYYEGNEYEDLEYANRINRFYYASPGMTYFDPFFNPWYGYGGLGFGFGNGFSLGFGWNSPYYGYGWGNPYYGYGYGGWGYPYYGGGYWGMNSYYNSWGHPYYGGGYYGGGYYGGVYNPRVDRTSVRSQNRDRFNARVGNNVNDRRGASNINRGSSTTVTRDNNGRILTGTRAAANAVDRSTTSGIRNSADSRRGNGSTGTIIRSNTNSAGDRNSTSGVISRDNSGRVPTGNTNNSNRASTTDRSGTSSTNSRRGTSAPATSRESYTPPSRSSNSGNTNSTPPTRSSSSESSMSRGSSGSSSSSGGVSRSTGGSSSSSGGGGGRSSGSSRR